MYIDIFNYIACVHIASIIFLSEILLLLVLTYISIYSFTYHIFFLYRAVVESRKIFRKLKSYAVYRVAATIQIVLVLTLLIYISNCTIQSIYIVLLALFNDVTLLPIAYDFQVASKAPESPNVRNLLILATILGCCQTGITMFFAYGIPYISIFQDSYTLTRRSISLSGCDEQTQAIIWIQVFIATEILAFSARAPSYFFLCHLPTWPLTAGIFIGCLIICLIANQSSEFGSLPSSDIALVWVWNIFWLFVVDAVKVQVLLFLNESTEILPELVLQGDVFTSAKSLHESTPTNDHTNASASGDVNGINSVVMNESTTMIGILPNQDTIYDTIINQSSDIYSDDDCTADDIESYAFKQREISQLGKLAISDGSSRKLGLDQLSVNVLNGSISVRGFSRSSRSLLSSQASF